MKILLILALAFVTIGCTTKAPTLATGPDVEKTFDGLVPVENSAFKRAWAAPDIDLSRYTKILPGPAEFEFRAVRGGNQTTRSSATEFEITDANRKKLVEVVSEVFNEELAKSTRFEITDRPGPDVLILRGAVLDIVSRVPPERAGRNDIFLSRFGEATIVLELMDSMSSETLVRAAERSAAESAGSRGMRASPVTTWSEVRRMARRWATKLRAGLDAVPSSTQGS
jgi:hypothetical protein